MEIKKLLSLLFHSLILHAGNSGGIIRIKHLSKYQLDVIFHINEKRCEAGIPLFFNGWLFEITLTVPLSVVLKYYVSF